MQAHFLSDSFFPCKQLQMCNELIARDITASRHIGQNKININTQADGKQKKKKKTHSLEPCAFTCVSTKKTCIYLSDEYCS